MVLTRAKNQPGPDGVLGTADDVQDATNTDSPWVDQSQTYTSHPSHQVFLREYVARTARPANRPVATGKLLGDPPRRPDRRRLADDDRQRHGDLGRGQAPGARRARHQLTDPDVLDMPMLATDPYGKFIPGPHGLPQS